MIYLDYLSVFTFLVQLARPGSSHWTQLYQEKMICLYQLSVAQLHAAFTGTGCQSINYKLSPTWCLLCQLGKMDTLIFPVEEIKSFFLLKRPCKQK